MDSSSRYFGAWLFILSLLLASGLSELQNNSRNTSSSLQNEGIQSNDIHAPVFIQHPSDQYASKKSPAVLQCTAQDAAKLMVSCSQIQLDDVDIEQHTERNSTTLQLKVHRRQLRTFTTVQCHCQAVGLDGSVRNSSTALIKAAYLKRFITIQPASHLVEQGENANITLRCSAQGVPTPSVCWMKTGSPLPLSSDGRMFLECVPGQASLVVTNTTVSDAGRYMCIAKNIVDEVKSPTVLVKIYVHGGWSEWMESGNCSKCGNGTQVLQRFCTNPTPQGGGRMCVGESIREESCHVPCTGLTDPVSDISLLPVFFLAGAVVPLVIICLVVIVIRVRSRSRHQSQPFSQEKEILGSAEREDGLPSQTITHSMSYQEAMEPSRQLKCPPPDPPEAVNPVLSELRKKLPTPLITEIKSERPERKRVSRSDSNVSKKSTVSDVSRMMWSMAQLPAHADPKFVAYGLIDHNGGKLTIPNSGVTLTVPHSAIPKGRTEAIYIALMKPEGAYPNLSDRQSMLTPVVICGPNGLTFQRSVILSMPHTALLNKGAWNLQVQCNQKDPKDTPEWKQLLDVNKEDPSQAEFVLMEPRACHLMVDHFTDYALVGESADGQSAVLQLLLVGYATPPTRDSDCHVRVYCVADTEAARQALRDQEALLYGETCDAPKPFDFKDGGGNLVLRLRNNREGWQADAAEKEIRFNHIWKGITRMPSATFVFSRQESADVSQFSCSFDAKQECPGGDGDEQEVNVMTTAKEPRSNRQAQTQTQTEAPPQERATADTGLEIACRPSSVFACSTPTSRLSSYQPTLDGSYLASPLSPHFSLASSGYFSFGFESLTSSLSLSEDTRIELMYLLDPPHLKADWRHLAEQFDYGQKEITWLQCCKGPPTLVLLHWLEIRGVTMETLTKVLRNLGRDDAAEVVEGALSRRLDTCRETVL